MNTVARQKTFISTSLKHFPLYLPREKLTFFTHPKFGSVHALYKADTTQSLATKIFSSWLTPLVYTSFNCNYFLASTHLINPNFISALLSFSDLLIPASVLINLALLNYKFAQERNKVTKVKEMYLKPNGKDVVFVNMRDEDFILNNINFSDAKLTYRFDIEGQPIRGKESTAETNYSGFRASVYYLGAREMQFSGNYKLIDHEVLHNVLHKYDIETKEVRHREKDFKLTFWTDEEKRQVLNYFNTHKVVYFQKLKESDFSYLRKKVRLTARKKAALKIGVRSVSVK